MVAYQGHLFVVNFQFDCENYSDRNEYTGLLTAALIDFTLMVAIAMIIEIAPDTMKVPAPKSTW